MQLVVYTQTYRCETADRQREIDECLRHNLNHPGIRKLVLFKESDAPPLPQATVELEVVESNERITYAEWFRWVQCQGIGLLLNADIYLNEGLENLAATFDTPETFLALTRYNPGHAGFHLNDYPHRTQEGSRNKLYHAMRAQHNSARLSPLSDRKLKMRPTVQQPSPSPRA
jgi:hypothetical protein